ncbi:fructose-1,6-bisphosphatase I [Chitinophaga dinghuensis]|uniref:Fructose-1,6-bisphosphatase class 1 n=1 Tax=Chitinophaga dinghuensis TaxID=1539050 RepID=A0A327W0G6_9BACT|nr:class 1 fructose-bisphosphatase [Chitinophaga dinghuensis]RAJ82123.1 fructose-1,6-bisphosphatase I [Chitinophaga dinghuensis]
MNHKERVMTLDEFTIQELRNYPGATGQLSGLLRDIGLAAKRVNVEVNKAGIADILGEVGKTNVQGESVKKLDEFANDQFIASLRTSIYCCGVASEEEENFIAFTDEHSRKSKYVVLMDPLDGSSNIDVNVSIGTIFSVYRRLSPEGEECNLEDFLQPGTQQIAAGYIIYGSSTMMVYATRRSVQGFTLDPSIGEFCLSHPNLKCPPESDIFSVNMGYYHLYDENIRHSIDHFMARNENDRIYRHRFVGCMVAEIHRTLIQGGIFMYPAFGKWKAGRLRLCYECNPMSFLMEKAGGVAMANGRQRLLELKPVQLHQRVPIFIGSKNMVDTWQDIVNKK